MVIGRRIGQNLIMFLIYSSVITAKVTLASKNEETALRAIHPSFYSVQYF